MTGVPFPTGLDTAHGAVAVGCSKSRARSAKLAISLVALVVTGAPGTLHAQSNRTAIESAAIATVCKSAAFEQVIAASKARAVEARAPWCARLFTDSTFPLQPRVLVGLYVGGDFAGRQVAIFGVLGDAVYLLTPVGANGLELLVSPNNWNSFLAASPGVRLDGATGAIQLACIFAGLATRLGLQGDCKGIMDVEAHFSSKGWRVRLMPVHVDVTITTAGLVSSFRARGFPDSK